MLFRSAFACHQERAGLWHVQGKAAVIDESLNLPWQLQDAKIVWRLCPVFAHPLRECLLGEFEVLHKAVESVGSLDGIELFTLNISIRAISMASWDDTSLIRAGILLSPASDEALQRRSPAMSLNSRHLCEIR